MTHSRPVVMIANILFVIMLLFSSGCATSHTSGASYDSIVQPEPYDRLPIVYSPKYDITFGGLERFHSFDTRKYSRTIKSLVQSGILSSDDLIQPPTPDDTVFLPVHSQNYLDSLQSSKAVAQLTEFPQLKWLPDSVAYNAVVKPLRIASAGTLLAAKLSVERGWAINVGGGFHHASRERYGGFCAIADISLAVHYLIEEVPDIERVLIVDLDAHQGNGHGTDFIGREDVYILDIYNFNIYPKDTYASQGIDLAVKLDSYTNDDEYLSKMNKALSKAFDDFKPQAVIYVAGTDVLEGDRLGRLSLSKDAVLARDYAVFNTALSRDIPIVMLLGGGYQRNNAGIIAASIGNLIEQFNLERQPP